MTTIRNPAQRLVNILCFSMIIASSVCMNAFANVTVSDKKGPVEQPLHNIELPDFANISDVKLKKQQFFNFLKPSIERENQLLLVTRARLTSIQTKLLNGETLLDYEQEEIVALAKKYKVTLEQEEVNIVQTLLIHVDIIPKGIILVQAANESAWGTSRFARIGLNFFGIWCYRPTCGMVPAGRKNGAKHEVAAFQSVDAAVKRYLYNINTHWAYKGLREKRAELRAEGKKLAAEELVVGLISYSQRGQAYVDEISSMLRYNKKYIL